MKNAVFGIASTYAQAEDIVADLKSSGFGTADISVLFPDKNLSRDFAHEKGTKAPEGALAGAGAGGLVGGTIGLLAGIGALAIPGLGPFIAAGPIMAAISGLAAGATVGGIAGALVGLGIPEYRATIYETHLRDGNILLAVHTENGTELARAIRSLERFGAHDVATTTETAVPSRKAG